MLSNTSGINTLLTESSSTALMGATGSSTASTDGRVSAFQGQLDKTMRQNARQSTGQENTSVDDANVSLSEDSAQTEVQTIADSQKPSLSTRQQDTEMNTVEKSNFAVRTTKQKVSDVEDALENGGGVEFLTELKNLLLALSNGDLDNLSLDENGLEALGDLLVQAGFDQASVEELMSNLTLALEENAGVISASDFMADLFELPLAEDEDITQADTLIPTSDLPYIKSLLSMMGVDEQQITAMMDDASEGTRGFDFDEFIEQLKQLLNTAQESGMTYQTEDDDNAYATLLKQLDLDSFIEDADAPLTLSTLIDAFTQKRNLLEDNLSNPTEQSLSEIFTTDDFDALATQSGRHGLLNQLFSGLTIQNDSEETVDSAVAISANADAMAKEIEDRFQVQFMTQINRNKVSANTSAGGQTGDSQTGATDTDDALKLSSTISGAGSSTKESTAQMALKAAQADAAATEKMNAANSLSGDSTSKGSDTQNLIFGVEKSTSTSTLGASGTQRTQQAFSTLPDFVTRQVGKSIVRSINTGNNTIQMQLKPPELGKVFLNIDHSGSSVKVSVITEHQSAKDILTANVNEIKTMLSSSGINLESFEVDMSSDFQQSMADARNQSAGKKQASQGTGDDTQDDMTDNLTVQTAAVNSNGSLHFVA
nr:flagellar hook-length control protein FliK [uncultured Desulfobacter sp.]